MKNSLSIEKVHKILDMSKHDFSRTQIATAVGCSKSTVHKYQKAYGIV